MVHLIIEGVTDKALLKRLLSDKQEKSDYLFSGLDGIGSVYKTIERLTAKDLKENIYFAIVDADNSFEQREQELTAKIGNKPVDYYIFPNHQNNGDLESLILEMIGDDKIIDCFDTYKKCVGQEIGNKAKLYAYTTLQHGKKPEKYIEDDLDINDTVFNGLKSKLQNVFQGID